MNKFKTIIIIAIIVVVSLIVLKKYKSPAQTFNKETSITHGHGLAVDISDSTKLYIATHHGLLILKDEKELFRIGASRDDYMGFSIHPSNANLFFSSGHPSKGGNIGVQKSEDGGVTWEKISEGVDGPVDFHAMAISPVNPDLMYGWYRGAVQRSDDGGKTWNIVNDNLLAAYLVADPQDENIVYAANPASNGILVSKNKGKDWQVLSKELEGGAIISLAIDPKNSKNIMTFSAKLGGLAKSEDGGLKWTRIAENFDGQTVLHIAFDGNNPSTIYALTHENVIYKSINGGEQWSKIY